MLSEREKLHNQYMAAYEEHKRLERAVVTIGTTVQRYDVPVSDGSEYMLQDQQELREKFAKVMIEGGIESPAKLVMETTSTVSEQWGMTNAGKKGINVDELENDSDVESQVEGSELEPKFRTATGILYMVQRMLRYMVKKVPWLHLVQELFASENIKQQKMWMVKRFVDKECAHGQYPSSLCKCFVIVEGIGKMKGFTKKVLYHRFTSTVAEFLVSIVKYESQKDNRYSVMVESKDEIEIDAVMREAVDEYLLQMTKRVLRTVDEFRQAVTERVCAAKATSEGTRLDSCRRIEMRRRKMFGHEIVDIEVIPVKYRFTRVDLERDLRLVREKHEALRQSLLVMQLERDRLKSENKMLTRAVAQRFEDMQQEILIEKKVVSTSSIVPRPLGENCTFEVETTYVTTERVVPTKPKLVEIDQGENLTMPDIIVLDS